MYACLVQIVSYVLVIVAIIYLWTNESESTRNQVYKLLLYSYIVGIMFFFNYYGSDENMTSVKIMKRRTSDYYDQ